MGDRGGTLLPGDSEGVVQVRVVHGGVVSEVVGGILPGPAWDDQETSVVDHSSHTIPQTLQGLFSAGSYVGGITSGGLWGSVVNAHQPLDSICAPPCAGHNGDFRLR